MKVLPPITKDEYHQLELYYFRLSEFANTDSYYQIPAKKRRKLDEEIRYIGATLDILFRLFSRDLKEEPIVAWKRKPDEDDNWERIYFFSCRKVAAKALGVNRDKISQVICDYRIHTGGYIFMNAKDYYEHEARATMEPAWYNR